MLEKDALQKKNEEFSRKEKEKDDKINQLIE